MEKQIIDELANSRYVVSEQKPVIVSAMGAILKQNCKVRLIHDCSRPLEVSVNDYAHSTDKMCYQSVKDACSLVNEGSYMCKIDLRSAYRYVPIHPSNYQFSGIKWQFSGDAKPTYLTDTRLMFGSKLAPNIFHRISQAIRRIMCLRYNIPIVAYLDDFFIAAPSYEECNSSMQKLIDLLHRLGFDIAWDKVQGPTQNLIVLGKNLNSVDMRMTLYLTHFESQGRIIIFMFG